MLFLSHCRAEREKIHLLINHIKECVEKIRKIFKRFAEYMFAEIKNFAKAENI